MKPSEIQPQIHESWKKLLQDEFAKPYFFDLKRKLLEERKNHTVYPPGKLIFHAFEKSPVDKVKVVILGQDPYHGPGQAHGLCFSVPPEVDAPPSLKNIFKEIQMDLKIATPDHGNLESWAEQGILLLNASLTVRAHAANSHTPFGWHDFTDAVIQRLSAKREGIVFLLWGSFARKKKDLITQGNNHYVLEAPHPSPLSAHRGFFGCRHFSRCNAILEKLGKEPIDWSLPPIKTLC